MNKSTKNGNVVLALVLSIIALLLCVLIFLLWIFEVIPHSSISSETFMGACVTLLSVIVTIAIGWQIFNVVEMKNTMKDLKEKQYVVDDLQKELKNEIQKVKDVTEDMKHHSMHLHAMTLAMIYDDAKRYDIAFIQCLNALTECMKLKEPLNTDFIMNRIEHCLDTLKGPIFVTPLVKQDILTWDKMIRASNDFPWIESKYEKLYMQFIRRIIVEE